MAPGPYRILAVDDHESNLLTLKACLPEGEFVFWGAAGAEEAYRHLSEEEFDLVLLDVLLPGIDGYEIARSLKSSPRTAKLPVIFLTALRQEEEIVKGFEAGGVDFISKPFHRTELLLRLRTHLTLRDKTQALERSAEELRRANHARDQFLSLLAHDLKNPFSGFLTLIERVREDFDSLPVTEVRQSLTTMEQTARNVYRLLETLLDWGQAQTGALVLDARAHLVSFLVEEALEPLDQAFREKQIAVTWESVSLWVWADRYTVVSILRNLLSNALKFTRPGGQVTVGGFLSDGRVSVFVKDNGVGISASRQAKLFHLDGKGSTPGTAREPGTGLGLILCQEFAEKNHGVLSVQSSPEVGTCFTLTLPAHLPEFASGQP